MILFEWGDRSRWVVKKVLGVKDCVTYELKQTAMKIVAAGFQHNVYNGPAFANVGAEVVGLDFELLNRINGRLDYFEADLLLVVIKPIQQEVVIGGG